MERVCNALTETLVGKAFEQWLESWSGCLIALWTEDDRFCSWSLRSYWKQTQVRGGERGSKGIQRYHPFLGRRAVALCITPDAKDDQLITMDVPSSDEGYLQLHVLLLWLFKR